MDAKGPPGSLFSWIAPVTVLSVLWWYNVSSDTRLSVIAMVYLQYVHSDSNVDVSYENVL